MLLATTLVAAGVGLAVHRAREQKLAVQFIRDQGGCVYYDFQERPQGSRRYDQTVQSSLPGWLLDRFGIDFFSDVACADLGTASMPLVPGRVPDAFPQAAVQHLLGLRKLKSLSFGGAELTDEALRCVGKLKSLEVLLAIRANGVTDAGIALLGGLTRLKTLVLINSSVGDESLKTLSRLRSLEHLQLEGSRISDRGLKHLEASTALQLLGVNRCRGPIGDSGISSLSPLIRLEALQLSDAKVTSAGLRDLKELRSLRHLDLSNDHGLTDDAIPFVVQFERLEELKLRNTRVTSEGIRHFSRLKKLRMLDVSDSLGVNDEALSHISRVTSLVELRLRNTKVSSAGVRHLSVLPKLQLLDLSENVAIDQDAVLQLAGIVTLRELDLHHTNVSLTKQNVGPLRTLKALRELNLAGTRSDCRATAAALPRCSVLGAEAASPGAADVLGEIGYLALIQGARLQQTHLSRVETARRYPDFKVRDFIPLAQVLPAKVTLRRMIGLAKHPGLAQTIAAQRPALEAFANTIDESSGQVRSPAEEGRKLLNLAKSNASMERLYEAAISLGFADGLSAYVQSLDDLRKSWALTDVQQEQYREASECLDTCLAEASGQLGLAAEFPTNSSASDGAGEAIIRVWKETQSRASQASGEDAIRRR